MNICPVEASADLATGWVAELDEQEARLHPRCVPFSGVHLNPQLQTELSLSMVCSLTRPNI